VVIRPSCQIWQLCHFLLKWQTCQILLLGAWPHRGWSRSAGRAAIAVDAEHLTKTYQPGQVEVRALDDVRVEIAAGAMACIMGKSGSGKSTLLRRLGLIDRPTGGQIWLHGREVAGLAERQRGELRLSPLSKLRGGMKFQTSADLGAAVQDQTASYQLISDILKFISLVMAAITIFTITYTDLVSKRRQIGIERAIGIRSGPIMLSYVLKARAYALAGVGTGFVLFRFAVTPLVHSHPFRFPNGPAPWPLKMARNWGSGGM
jgi:hypothetical protein